MAYAVHTRSCTYLLDDDGICRWTLAPTGVPVPGAERYLGAQFVACLDVREIGGLVGELRNGAAALFARSENGRLVLLRTPAIEFVEHRSDDDDPSAPAPAPAIAGPGELPSYAPEADPLPAYVPRPTAAPPRPALPSYPSRPAAALPVYPPRPPAAPPPPAPAAFVPLAPLVHAPLVHAPRRLPPLSPPASAAPTQRAPLQPGPRQPAPTAALPEGSPTSTDTLPLAPMHRLPVPSTRTPEAPPAARFTYREPYASETEIEPEEEYLSELDVEELVTFSEVTLTIPLYRPEAQTTPPAPRRNVIGPGRRLR